MANEDEINRISYELQLQQAKGEAIKKQLENMQAGMVEVGGAMEILKNLKKATKGESLLPVGAGVYLSYSKPDIGRVLVNAGANVIVEKKPEDAIKMLEERQKSIANAISTAQQDMGTVVGTIERLNERASMLAVGESKNVRPAKE